MMLQPVVLLLMLVWTGGLSWGVISLVREGLLSGRWRWHDLLGVSAMLTVGTAFWLFAFWREIRMTEEVLARVLDGHGLSAAI